MVCLRTRALQKLIEVLRNEEETNLVISPIQSSFLNLVTDPNGNHVVQRCLRHFSDEQSKVNMSPLLGHELRRASKLCGFFIAWKNPLLHCSLISYFYIFHSLFLKLLQVTVLTLQLIGMDVASYNNA